MTDTHTSHSDSEKVFAMTRKTSSKSLRASPVTLNPTRNGTNKILGKHTTLVPRVKLNMVHFQRERSYEHFYD